jgi:hypothetical protein
MGRSAFFGAAALTAVTPALHAAEPWVYKAEVFGSVGLGRFYPANRIWRNGTELGGGFGFRPYAGTRRKLEFETRVEHIGFTGSQGQEGIWSETVEGTALFFSEAFLWHFTESNVQPYVLGEAGAIRTDFTKTYVCPVCGGTPSITAQTPIQLLFGVGGGVKIRLSKHLSVRPEVRIHQTMLGENLGSARFSIGLGGHW